MSNLLFGSSNICRHFDRAHASGRFAGRNLQLIRCTQKSVLDAHLVTLTDARLIVTSVLENFIMDVCNGVGEDEVQLFAHQQITAHVEDLHSVIGRLPDLTVLIMPPMFRSTPSWYGPYLTDLQSFLSSEVTRVGSDRMAICPPFLVLPSLLEDDGVHLTPVGGDRLMTHIDSALNSLLIEVEEGSTAGDVQEVNPGSPEPAHPADQISKILDVVSRSSAKLESISALSGTVTNLTQSTANFESYVRRRFKKDDFIFARMKEESDAIVNRAREDRVVITGLPSPAVASSSHAAKKTHYTEVINRLITLACLEADPLPRVVDLYINLRKDRGLPLVEVRLDSASGAGLFRREGVRLAKAKNEEFASLFFSNSVTQSTRVRIDILKEIAKKLTTKTEVGYVQGFLSRPVLQYRIREGERSSADGTGRSYNFVDAVAKFGSRLSHRDLSTAYARAGDTFTGALSQYFVVLSDDVVIRGRSANRMPLGRRGGRGGGIPRPSASRSLFAQGGPPSVKDRGLKRPSDVPVDTPSKRKDNDTESELVVMEEL